MKKNQLEYVNCEICGRNFTKDIFVERGFHIVQCINCKLVYVNPRFSKEEYKEKTNHNYENLVEESLSYQGYKEIKEKIASKGGLNKQLYIKSRLKQAADNLKEIERLYRQKGRLLDVGCGEGFFLKKAIFNGWQVCGVEMSKKHRPPSGDNLNVLSDDILTVELPQNYFDIITMWDVLEHLPYPNDTIKKLNSFLKKGGLLVIRVPNVRYLKLKQGLVSSIFGKDFYLKSKNFSILGFYAPETHFYNFSEITLEKLLRKNHLKIIKVQLGKFASGATMLREIIHNSLFYIFKLIYFLSVGRLNINCSITVFAQKENNF